MTKDLSAAVVLMDFPQAMQAVYSGEKVTKLEWDNREDYGRLRNDMLMIYRDGKWYNWLISLGDMEGDDWVVLT